MNRILAKVGTLERDLAELRQLIVDESPLAEAVLRAYRLLEGAAFAIKEGKPIPWPDWDGLVRTAGYPHAGYTGGFFSHEGRSLEWSPKPASGWETLAVTAKGYANLQWYRDKLIRSHQIMDVEVVRRLSGQWTRIRPRSGQAGW